ncbi:MAG: DEAD/DEAH box helicase, partial [Deinococcota bacterium]
NVVIATPTASGKSLCYQLPTLEALATGGTVLYLFPTKALARDQMMSLRGLINNLGDVNGISPGDVTSYDGDTPSEARQSIREHPRCIITNPDMLHYGLLPHHLKWGELWRNLRYLVLDELHSYRGVMGSHVANIVRRLMRVAHHYGARPQLIAASATIGNPAQHAYNISGEVFTAVDQDSSPRAAREVIFWQPPVISAKNDPDLRRRSTLSEAADLASLFVKANLKSIFFCNARKSAELLRHYATRSLSEAEAPLIQSYRAGYLPEDRRALEDAFKADEITVLSATSALELGVDIGGVDAVVMVGYPGSLTSFWQRAGRAGRASTRALTLMISADNPLDSYYLGHPDDILEGRAEHAVADAFNSELQPYHLACAAYERPLHAGESLAQNLPEAGAYLHKRTDKHGDVWLTRLRYPHRHVSVRGTGGQRVRLYDGFGTSLGISDYDTALRELHPGAVYLHRGEHYLVRNLDLNQGVAVLLPHIEDYYTQTRFVTDIDILEPLFTWPGVTVGKINVTTSFTSFVRKRYYSEAILDERPLDLPPISYPTQALWVNMRGLAPQLGKYAPLFAEGMHALEHTLIGLLPAFVLCERMDVGGVSYPTYPATGEPVMFIYDGYPGGVGYAAAGASLFERWLTAAKDLLTSCPCKHGCPSCTLSPKCGNGNQYLDKDAARTLAEVLLKRLIPAVHHA